MVVSEGPRPASAFWFSNSRTRVIRMVLLGVRVVPPRPQAGTPWDGGFRVAYNLQSLAQRWCPGGSRKVASCTGPAWQERSKAASRSASSPGPPPLTDQSGGYPASVLREIPKASPQRGKRIVEVQGTGLGHSLLEDLGAEGVEGSLGSSYVLLGQDTGSPAGLEAAPFPGSGAVVFVLPRCFLGLPDPPDSHRRCKQGQGQEPP